MGFYIQDDYYTKAVKRLKPRQQEQLWAAIIRYYFEPGYNVDDAKLCDYALGLFDGAQSRIDKSKKQTALNKEKREQEQNVAQQNEKCCSNVAQQNEKCCSNVAQQNKNYPSMILESESESENIATAIYATDCSSGDFISQSLALWNELTSSDMRSFPQSSIDGLLQAKANGRTLDDIRRVIELSLTWEPRYRTPHGVFADGKIEQWLSRLETAQPKNYAPSCECPQCGEDREAVNPGMYHCKTCGITWRDIA